MRNYRVTYYSPSQKKNFTYTTYSLNCSHHDDNLTFIVSISHVIIIPINNIIKLEII